MPTQANNNQSQKSGNSQGGTHEQHVKAGQQSHKNDAQSSGQGSKSVSSNNTGNQQRNDSKSAPDSRNR